MARLEAAKIPYVMHGLRGIDVPTDRAAAVRELLGDLVMLDDRDGLTEGVA